MSKDNADVKAFQAKFGIDMPEVPTFLSEEAFKFRSNFLQEELDEFKRDHAKGDMEGVADALVDLVYVAHGTALMMGIPWDKIWDEVQRANMSKIRATSPEQSKRGTALDIIKPEGWKGPDHKAALNLNHE
jgi:predicted HAD superfamily Cof-like phosphohydrolase